jgi:hypothetical protein
VAKQPASSTGKQRKPGRHALTLMEQIWIIQQYAVYRRQSEIRVDFKEKYGRDVPEARLHQLGRITLCNGDVEKARKHRLMGMLPIFMETRASFNTQTAEIPIANAVYRIKVLDDLLGNALAKKNYHSAAKILQQADRATGSTRRAVAPDGQANEDFSKGVGNIAPLTEMQRDAIYERLLLETRKQLPDHTS